MIADSADQSLFDDFGGYYSVMVDGVEIARWAPSNAWSEYWSEVQSREGWSYRWVVTPERAPKIPTEKVKVK